VAFTSCVTPSIPHLVSVKVIEGLVSTFRMWASITVMRIEAVINVAVKVMRTVKPGAGSGEHAAREPLGSIVAVRGAVVRGKVVITIRANWFWSDIDGDLCAGAPNAQQGGNQCGKGKRFPKAHVILVVLKKKQPTCQTAAANRRQINGKKRPILEQSARVGVPSG